MFSTINNNVIKTLGIDALPLEQQEEAMQKMGAIVYQEVMLRVLDIMSEEDKDEFEKLIETNPDPEAMFTFLGQKVSNIEEIVAEEAEKFRKESVDIMSQIGN